MNYSEIAIRKINESEILPSKELAQLVEIQGELQNGYEKKQMWRSEVEAKYSVLNNVIHPSKSSKYWQAVREQSGMYRELISLAINYQEKLGKMEIAKAEIKRIEFALIDMKLQAKDRVRECLMWSHLKAQLDDGSFDTNNFQANHLEDYKQRWELEKNIAIQSNNATVYKNSVSNLNTLLEDIKNEQ
jgi:hypothetical protein